MLSLDGFASHANIVNYGTSKLACHLRRSLGLQRLKGEEEKLADTFKKKENKNEEGGKKRQELPPPPKRNENALNQSWPKRRLDEGLCMGGRGRERGGIDHAKAFVVPWSLM